MHAPTPKPVPLLDLDLLRTLVAISETGNFSTAAQRLFRTPSAISMQVKKIEDLLERPVFKREPRHVHLNEDGQILLSHARRMLALNGDVMARFAAPSVSGTVRLGALDHATEQFLPNALCRFAESYPGITVDVLVENSTELTELFNRNQLDIAIITKCAISGWPEHCEILFEEELVWAGLRGGVAIEQDPLPVSVWEEGCIWRQLALQALESQGRNYRINFKSASISGQKAGVLADLAIAPLPRSSCSGEVEVLDGTCNLPPLGSFEVSMMVQPNAAPAIATLANHLKVCDFVSKQ